MVMISTLLAITVVLLPVALGGYLLGYQRFVNKKFIIDKLKYPTLSRLQNHLYLSDTKAREKEYTARHAQIKAERTKVLAELEEQFKPNRESLKRRHYENSRQLSQFQREMDMLSGLFEQPKALPAPSNHLRVLKFDTYVRELPYLSSPQVRLATKHPSIEVDCWAFGELYDSPNAGISNIWFHTMEGGWIWSGGFEDQNTAGLPQAPNFTVPVTNKEVQSMKQARKDFFDTHISTGGENPIEISKDGLIVDGVIGARHM